MKRTLYALVPWMVLATAAHGQVRAADVVYTHANSIPVRAFRLGDECFVPIRMTSEWKWRVDEKADQATIHAEDLTVSAPVRVFASERCVPLRKVVSLLGGQTGWILGTDTLEVFSELPTVTARNGKVKISSPLLVKPSTFVLTNPSRVVIDLSGAKLGKQTKLDVDDNVHVTQYGPRIVRVVIDTDAVEDLVRPKEDPTKSVTLELGTQKPLRDDLVEPVKTGDSTTNKTTPTVPGTPISLPVTVDQDTSSATLLNIPLPGIKDVSFSKPDPTTLEVRLPKTNATLPSDFRLSTSAISQTSARQDGDTTVLTLTLTRPMGANLWADAAGVQIQLVKPDVGNGRLAGKVIVVDPGHGGNDKGAHRGDLNEKDLNLVIGRLLAQELASAGVTVIMTRKTDVFIPLTTRAQIANSNKADFFLSCHINSSGSDNTTSGTITFFHKNKATSKLLAECIQRELAKVNKLPSIGAWSDGKIYQSGFAVLRGTTMPGVLLELGFINNSKDRARMQEQEFQSSVAKAVVQGLKVYLGDE